MADTRVLSREQGAQGELIAKRQLEDAGLEIVATHVKLGGVEADFHVRTKQGVDAFVSVKWSVRGKRPGCIRTDTLKKAVAEAWFIKMETGNQPVLLMTSHLPSRGAGAKMLQVARDEHLFDMVIDMSDPASVATLRELHGR